MKLIMTRGLAGAGKSTWAREMCDKHPGKYKLVDKDSLRKLLDNGKWSKTNEKLVLKVRDSIIENALRDGYSVIVHDTNLEVMHEQRLRELAKAAQAEFEIKDFTDIPLETCIANDLKRFDSIGEAVIRKMHARYFTKPVLPIDPPEAIEGLPEAIICDLDGTLALFGDRRSPYQADKCEEDDVNWVVWSVVESWLAKGTVEEPRELILMSGRQEEHRPQTERWLKHWDLGHSALFMRATGDQRKDSIVKRELFENHVLGKWNIAFAIDDRDQVVKDTWRALGLVCFQCADGNF